MVGRPWWASPIGTGLPPSELRLGTPQDSCKLSWTVRSLSSPQHQYMFAGSDNQGVCMERGLYSAFPMSSVCLCMEDDVFHVAGGLHLRLHFDPQPSGTHTKERPFICTERNETDRQCKNNSTLNKTICHWIKWSRTIQCWINRQGVLDNWVVNRMLRGLGRQQDTRTSGVASMLLVCVRVGFTSWRQYVKMEGRKWSALRD